MAVGVQATAHPHRYNPMQPRKERTMSSVTTTLVQVTRHPATREVVRCAVMCAAAAARRRLDGPTLSPHTPGGHNRGCSA